MSIQTAILEQQVKVKLEAGDYHGAYALLREMILLNENDDVTVLEQAIAIAYEQLGLFEDVINYANIILAKDSNNTYVRLQRGWAQYDSGNCELAFSDFQKVLDEMHEYEDHVYARSGRGLCYFTLGQYEDAMVDLADAITYYDDWAIGLSHLGWSYYFLHQYNDAKKHLDRAIELSSNPYYFAHAGRALTCYELREYDTAITDFTISLTHEYENWVQGYATRGWCYLDINFYEDQLVLALADFDKAIELAPETYIYAYGGRGLTHYELGNYEEAIADLDRVLVDDFEWVRGYGTRAWSKYHYAETKAEYEAALDDFNNVSLLLDEADAHFVIAGRGCTHFKLENYKAAIHDLQIGVDHYQSWLMGYLFLADAYKAVSDTEQALSTYMNALEYIEDKTEVYREIALYYEQLGQHDEAQKYYEKIEQET